ncbi:glycosyl transferase [Streptomyces sp. BSE7F]|uniref:bifunctional glycosyltransferase family 2/GtrA family protein n=1 Tax=Streptomyces sp. BSE7-9 TaxID=2759948 RepID=UPI000D6191B6|nr:bifunctional glycosyltransferase family 2/GtrA family protein [Streptomyces sp. BSE7-9]MBJ6645161.1 glycosyltransferase [Streptomyces sp. BSE7-9]PWE08256.1 glycosyl transferase [Streptomyces sp. BSE7F]
MRSDLCSGTLPARKHLPAAWAGTPVLDVVVPVHNEEEDLRPCVRRLHEHLTRTFPYAFRITIADNASTDGTPAVAADLARRIEEVRSVRLERKGRGRALRTVWSASDAPVLAYMDVDLSTDLNALLPLVAPLISGHSDLAIGSRLSRGARVVRGAKREVISRGYNLILRGSLQARFSDAQCGFKAIRRDVAQVLLPLVEDSGWFFDTELLVLAERAGLRIHEVPVDWVDDPDSTVHIVRTATEDLKGVWRVGRALATGALPLDRLARPFGDDPRDRELADVPRGLARQLVGFCAVGALSTVFYLLLYSAFRAVTGAQLANGLALLVSAVANTAANRRLTFRVRGRGGMVRHQAQGLVVLAIGLALTSGSLAALDTASSDPARSTELAVLVAANLAATVLRFLLFRVWVFPDRGQARAGDTDARQAGVTPARTATGHGATAHAPGPPGASSATQASPPRRGAASAASAAPPRQAAPWTASEAGPAPRPDTPARPPLPSRPAPQADDDPRTTR